MSRRHLNRRFLIVGEGRETEYNYLLGLRKIHEEDLKAMAISISPRRGKGGNAKNIVEHAIKESRNFKPNRKNGDRVFLLLDTEGAGRAPELPPAEVLAAKNGIEIVYSSPSFEYWLRCHFDNAPRGYFANCAAVIAALNPLWLSVSKDPYHKSDANVFTRLASRFPNARQQSLEIDLWHTIHSGDACGKNPSSQVYELVARLVGAQSGERCPITGAWEVIGYPGKSQQLQKGQLMPQHDSQSVLWKKSE